MRLAAYVAVAGALIAGCSATWQDYESQRWGVSASFPQSPHETDWAVSTPAGSVGGVLVDTQVLGSRAEWFVLFCLYVPGDLDRRVVATGIEVEMTKGLGEVVRRSSVALNGLQGTEVLVRGPAAGRRLRY
jgi:hypothetical protein